MKKNIVLFYLVGILSLSSTLLIRSDIVSGSDEPGVWERDNNSTKGRTDLNLWNDFDEVKFIGDYKGGGDYHISIMGITSKFDQDITDDMENDLKPKLQQYLSWVGDAFVNDAKARGHIFCHCVDENCPMFSYEAHAAPVAGFKKKSMSLWAKVHCDGINDGRDPKDRPFALGNKFLA